MKSIFYSSRNDYINASAYFSCKLTVYPTHSE